jgi:hypothetical protein
MKIEETPSPLRRRLRYCLIALAAFAVTVGLFYAEEDVRGWQAMKKCKQELAAEGVDLDWKKSIPPAVPDNENVFGVALMQDWFVRKDTPKPRLYSPPWSNELPQKMTFPGWNNTNRSIVAHVIIGLPGTNAPAGSTVINGDNPQARFQIMQLVTNMFGPIVIDPVGAFYTKVPFSQLRPAQIFLQCQTQPGEADLKKLVPVGIISGTNYGQWAFEQGRVENFQPGSCDVTINIPGTASEYLEWWKTFESDMHTIREALKRPYSRMIGDYSKPENIPIPAFVNIRATAQRLVASARCHLLLGQTEEALDDLTFLHNLCRRVLEENKPMTLVSAMINVAIRGLSAQVVDEGLQAHVWNESQLAALEKQAQQVNLISPVAAALRLERFHICYRLYTDTPAQFLSLVTSKSTHTFAEMYLTIVRELIPRGWAWQNMANAADVYRPAMGLYDPTNRAVFPDKVDEADKIFYRHVRALGHAWPPYFFMAAFGIPNYARAAQTSIRNQTMIDHALIVCGLERYRLVHGAYPPKLDDLVPQFIDVIPHDIIGGQPPRYHLNPDGTFLLYSIGWDQKDHGGDPKSDYVWPEKFQ